MWNLKKKKREEKVMIKLRKRDQICVYQRQGLGRKLGEGAQKVPTTRDIMYNIMIIANTAA